MANGGPYKVAQIKRHGYTFLLLNLQHFTTFGTYKLYMYKATNEMVLTVLTKPLEIILLIYLHTY